MRNLMTFLAVALLAAPAIAATVSNCDEIPRAITIDNAGEFRDYTLPVGRSIEVTGPMVAVSVEKGPFIRVQMRDVYCVRRGNLSLQMRRPYSNKSQ